MDTQQTASLTVAHVKRIHGKAQLTLSNGETLIMPRALLRERPYRGGMPFDRAAHDALITTRPYPFALEKAISLLAARARTEREIVTALRENAYSEETIARVMARLHEAGYIDDADFADQWAASRASKGMGSRRIRMELRQKGVESEAIDRALSSMDEDALFDGALQAARKTARGKNLSLPADRQKVLAALARRGFDFALARRALQAVIDETD